MESLGPRLREDDEQNGTCYKSSFAAVCPNDGGRSSGAVPNCLFGVSPISKTSVPPFASSACVIQLFVHGLPFHVTDWMYGLPLPFPRASTMRFRPSPTSISAWSISGLPNTQFVLTGSTG